MFSLYRVRVAILMTAMAVAGLSTGCGPAPLSPQDSNYASALNKSISFGLSANGASSNWNCPTYNRANILPKNLPGVGSFVVCSSRSGDPSKFQISGTTSSHNLYVYPFYVAGNSTNLALNQGMTLVAGPALFSPDSGNAAEITFSGVTGTINYVVIVDENNTSAMNLCLGGASCPADSEGFIH